MPFCDGILASTQPLRDLAASGAIEPRHRTYLSLNRTGLAGSAFELDDRLVASVEQAAAEGWTGVKHMTRIDMTDPLTAPALELLGQVLEEARSFGLDALVEPLSWRDGRVAPDTDSIVFAAIVAHDLGAPVVKAAIPDVAPGAARVDGGGADRLLCRCPRPLSRGPAGVPKPRGRATPRRCPRGDSRRHGRWGRRSRRRTRRLPGPRPGGDGAARRRSCARRCTPCRQWACRVRPGVILTIDLGTSVTKVVVWGEDGQVALGRSPLVCNTQQTTGPNRTRRRGGPRS